jgi:hypothetical protein
MSIVAAGGNAADNVSIGGQYSWNGPVVPATTDRLFMGAYRANNAAATAPASPAWQIHSSAGANTLSLVTASMAQPSTGGTAVTATGTWTGATQIVMFVVRAVAPPNTTNPSVSLGVASYYNAAATTSIMYPALNLAAFTGVRAAVRIVTRSAASEIVGPPGWDLRLMQPTGSGFLAVFFKENVTSVPEVVVPQPSSAAYRVHSYEVRAGNATAVTNSLMRWNGSAWVVQ